MTKSIDIFAPEDLEFDLGQLGFGKYTVPGDIPTQMVLKLMALEDKKEEKPEEAFEAMRELVKEIFAIKQDDISEIESIGLVALSQIVTGITVHFFDMVEEAKNRMTREVEARANRQE